jgi:GNAT superfamily N-acetyltransferase
VDVTVPETLSELRTSTDLLTTCGAQIEVISIDTARIFLDRFGQPSSIAGTACSAWGVFQDSTTLIGVAALAISGSSTNGQAFLSVMPIRRRLGVGSDLLQLLVDEAGMRGLRTLVGVYPAADPAPQGLARALGLTVARRIDDKSARIVILLSDPTPSNPQGEQ